MEKSLANIAVLTSGGLDSAILLADLARLYQAVQPVYVRSGLYWESVELEHLKCYLEALQSPAVRPLVVLEMPARDLYGSHWSVTGRDVPDAGSADDAVYLPGRNILLLTKALLWCHLQQIPALALATLRSNPFPDARHGFFDQLETLFADALGHAVVIERPYAQLSKRQVLERGKALPLEWTFSCIRPVAGNHCGECNKCAERQKAFAEAGIMDLTAYARGQGG